MADTTVNLGGFEFAQFEVPETIPFGGEQSLVVHKLVGGVRVVDAMGEDPAPLDWSGIFTGAQALDRALYVDSLRKAGKPISLTWSELSYTVMIKSFHCDFQRFYRLPYRISCEVVSDDAAPISSSADASPEQLIGDDLTSAGGLSDLIGDSGLTSAMGGLTLAVSAVGSLATASQSALNSILLPLSDAQSRVGDLLEMADSAIAGVPGIGGIVAGLGVDDLVSSIAGQIGTVAQMPTLITLGGTLGRIASNIGTFNGGTRSLTTAGGNLFSIAADEYGDPMGWTAIAAANGLADPALTGIATLAIPPFNNDTGGVLSG